MSNNTVQVEVSIEDFLTAGLEPEGIYRINIKKMDVVERTNRETGEKFTQIAGQYQLVERFGDDILPHPVNTWTSMSIEGRGLERFSKLYIAAFGALPQKEGKVSINDLAASLVGNDTVWTQYSWGRKKNKEDIEGNIGYNFSQNPSDLKEPTPFADRDNG